MRTVLCVLTLVGVLAAAAPRLYADAQMRQLHAMIDRVDDDEDEFAYDTERDLTPPYREVTVLMERSHGRWVGTFVMVPQEPEMTPVVCFATPEKVTAQCFYAHWGDDKVTVYTVNPNRTHI